MGGFEINRNECFSRFLSLENRANIREVLTIFYQNFIICKIIFLAISSVCSFGERFFWYEWCIAIFATDDILTIIGSEYRIFAFYTIEKVASFEDDISRDSKSSEGQCDDAHTSEGSWSTDTPNFFDTMKLDKFDNFVRKTEKIISPRNSNDFFA